MGGQGLWIGGGGDTQCTVITGPAVTKAVGALTASTNTLNPPPPRPIPIGFFVTIDFTFHSVSAHGDCSVQIDLYDTDNVRIQTLYVEQGGSIGAISIGTANNFYGPFACTWETQHRLEAEFVASGPDLNYSLSLDGTPIQNGTEPVTGNGLLANLFLSITRSVAATAQAICNGITVTQHD